MSQVAVIAGRTLAAAARNLVGLILVAWRRHSGQGPGHTLDTHHGLPADLRQHLNGFDTALEKHIRRALIEGVNQGEFRLDLNIDTDTALVQHLLSGLSTLVADSPPDAARIVAEVTRTTLAAVEAV
jgi:hypothetical protein